MCGVGGRNQHFVLYVATQVRREDHSIAILSAASDGIDGNSPFAGAVVDDVTLELLRSGEAPEGVTMSEAVAALDGFDASTVLRRLHATIETGPTGNNLRDLRILLG
jgi:hydroxypyruvate reductase